MAEISLFADESGKTGTESRYCLLTVVFHDQDEDIAPQIALYEQVLRDKGLPDVPLHAGPLMNGHDDGQAVITKALHDAAEYAIAADAVIYRMASPRDYRLAQAADLVCTIELTAAKYRAGEQTSIDERFFGAWGSFKKNRLKKVRSKLL